MRSFAPCLASGLLCACGGSLPAPLNPSVTDANIATVDSSPMGDVGSAAVSFYLPSWFLQASSSAKDLTSGASRQEQDPNLGHPTATVSLSNLALCSGVSPGGDFYILQFNLTESAADGQTFVGLTPGVYPLFSYVQPGAEPPAGRVAQGTLNVYGDPTNCSHLPTTAGAYCNQTGQFSVTGGSVTVSSIVLDSDVGAIAGSFRDMQYLGSTGPFATAAQAPPILSGNFDTKVCAINLQPPAAGLINNL